MSDVADWPVIIAGGGPIGLCTALELSLHGVPSLVLERRPPDCEFPMRTNLTNLRTMEHFRRWGVAERLRANDPIDATFERSTTWVTQLNGHLVRDFPRAFDFAEPTPLGSDRPVWAPNTAIERTLQEAASENPRIDLRFESELTDFSQDEAGVEVRYRGADGAEHRARGRYLVGADGSRSFVRKALGVRMEGQSNLVVASVWHVEAPGMMERSTVGKSSFYWYINEHRDSAITIVQDSERDRYMFMLVPMPEGFDPDDWGDVRSLFYRNIGFELPVKNLGGGTVSIHSLIAPRFDHGRVFLAGDAAHLISPLGGFGMNIGIGDSADLGWKLAAVVNGWGGPKLLESYGIERSSAIRWIQQECIENTGTLAPQLVENGISADTAEGQAIRDRVGERIYAAKIKEFASYGAQLGYRYEGSPVIVADGTEPPPLSMATYTPSAFPGCRAPHVWLSEGVSLFDELGAEFTLLKLDADIDTGGIEEAARLRGVPLKVIAPEHEELRELYMAKLALIRPDQHVAWRGDAVPADPLKVIDTVRGA